MNTLTSEPYVACERCRQMMPPSDLHPCGPGGRWRYCGRCINEAEARPTDTVIRTSNERLPKLCDYPGCCVSTFNAYCERHQPAPPDYLLDAEIQAQGIEGMTHEIKRLRAENSRLWLLKRGSPETSEQPEVPRGLLQMPDGNSFVRVPLPIILEVEALREFKRNQETPKPCADCLDAQSIITDFDSEISDGDVPDRLGDLLPKLVSAADAVDMVRTATLLHKLNCECEACYWIGRSPLAQQQANAKKATD